MIHKRCMMFFFFKFQQEKTICANEKIIPSPTTCNKTLFLFKSLSVCLMPQALFYAYRINSIDSERLQRQKHPVIKRKRLKQTEGRKFNLK